MWLLKDFQQWRHRKGVSPVWVIRWCFSPIGTLNGVSHSGQILVNRTVTRWSAGVKLDFTGLYSQNAVCFYDLHPSRGCYCVLPVLRAALAVYEVAQAVEHDLVPPAELAVALAARDLPGGRRPVPVHAPHLQYSEEGLEKF